MPVISEEEADDDAVLLPGSRPPFLRHHSSGSSNLDAADSDHHNHHNEQDEDEDDDDDDDEDAYSSTEYDDDEEEEDGAALPPRTPFSQNAFAPPFYGRPPTPLPPSPSLTSLLRPSRPTTPDASDDDGGGGGAGTGTGTGGGGGGRDGHPGEPLPRARPKVPTYEYYGFVLYLFSSLSFLIYLLWSYLPSPFLHALGIYYYPNRWWSLAIPSFLVMLLVYIYVALAGYNVEILTLALESVETVVDEAAMVAVVDGRGRIVRGDREKRRREGGGGGSRRGKGKREGRAAAMREKGGGSGGSSSRVLNWREVWDEGTDAVMDVPLAGVCEVLYGEGRDWDSEVEEGEGGITRV